MRLCPPYAPYAPPFPRPGDNARCTSSDWRVVPVFSEDAMQVRARRRRRYSQAGCDLRHVAAFQHFIDQGGFGARQAELLLMLLGFAGVGFIAYRRKKLAALAA